MKDLIFIDESGVNLAMVRMYARALKGERARGERPQQRGRNISLIACFITRRSRGIQQYLWVSGCNNTRSIHCYKISS